MQFTVNSKLPITGFELWISSVRSDSCTKCATTAGFCFKLDFLKADSRFFYSGRMLWSRSLQGLSGSIRDFATGGLHQQESCWRWVAESLLSRYLLHARLARWADGTNQDEDCELCLHWTIIWVYNQCDHMACLFVQYLAIYSNEIWTIPSTFYQSWLSIISNTKWTLEKIDKGF